MNNIKSILIVKVGKLCLRLFLFVIIATYLTKQINYASDEQIIWNLEQPGPNNSYIVSSSDEKIEIVGWALNPIFIDKINVFIDDKLMGEAKYGIDRPDVLKAYPLINKSNKSGFNFEMPNNNFEAGEHKISVELISKSGQNYTLSNNLIIEQKKNKSFSNLEYPNKKKVNVIKSPLQITGWIIDQSRVKIVQIYLDDKLLGDALYGILRPDVKEAYANIKGSENSGFSYEFNVSSLSKGTHKLNVLGVTNDGTTKEIGSIELFKGYHFTTVFILAGVLLFILLFCVKCKPK